MAQKVMKGLRAFWIFFRIFLMAQFCGMIFIVLPNRISEVIIQKFITLEITILGCRVGG